MDHGSTSVNFTSWAREPDSFYEIISRPKGGEEREGSGFEEETRKGIGAPLLLYGKLAYNNNKVVVGR